MGDSARTSYRTSACIRPKRLYCRAIAASSVPRGGTMRIRLLIPLAASCLAALPAPSAAQRPSAIAVTATDSLKPLPVLDDFGDMIPESMIQKHMRHGSIRWYMQPFGFIAGGIVAYAAFPHGKSNDNCSIYDPCSDREKFYRGSSFWIG